MDPTDVAFDDERITDFGRMVEAYARLHRCFEHSLKEQCGLTSATFELLLRLVRSPDRRLTMGELAEQLAITGGGVTRLVDRVIGTGLVARSPCPDDRRIQWVTLTEAGLAKVAEATSVHLDDLQREFHDRLTKADLDHLRIVMDKLRSTP